MTDPQQYCRNPKTLWRRLASAIVVLGPGAHTPSAITGPAAEIWDLLAVPVTFEDAAARLASAHGASLDDVRRDLAPVIERLIRDGAVERCP